MQALFGAGLLIFGVIGVQAELSSRQALVHGTAIANNVRILPEEIGILESIPSNAELPCRRQVQQAAATVRLATLDLRLKMPLQIQFLDEDYRAVQAGLEHLLTCFPYNSNGWLRLAMVWSRFEGPSQKVVDAVEVSRLFAPREGWLLGPRIAFLVSLTQTGNQRVDELLKRDIDTMINGLPLPLVEKVNDMLGPYGRDRIAARFFERHYEKLKSSNPGLLQKYLAALGLPPEDMNCSRYFYRLNTCAGKS